MTERPDLYELDFDIYGIDFEVFEPVPDIQGSKELTEPLLSPTVLHEPSELVTEPDQVKAQVVGSIVTRESLDLPDAEVLIPQVEEARNERQPQIEVPEQIQKKVTEAIDKALEQSKRPFIQYTQIKDLVCGSARLSKEDNRILIEAAKRDGRIEYFRDGAYMIVAKSDEVMQAYMDGKDPLADTDYVQGLVTVILENIDPVWHELGGRLSHRNLLGTLKANGHWLNKDELNEFLVLLAQHPDITPLPNGNFDLTIAKRPEVIVSPTRDGKILSLDFLEGAETDSETRKPLSRGQINKAISESMASEGWKYARRVERERGRRPKRTTSKGTAGKKSAMGKNHGKKVSIDTLISQMNNPTTSK